MTTKRKPGRPADAEAILDAHGLDALCDDIADGKSRRQICKELGVDRGSLRRWLSLDEERARRANQAWIDAADAYVERAEEVIEKARSDFQLAKAKEQSHHFRWKAKMANPRRYSDKLALGGSDDMPPINHSIKVEFVGTEQPAQP